MERKCGIALTMPYRNIQNLKNILMKALKIQGIAGFLAAKKLERQLENAPFFSYEVFPALLNLIKKFKKQKKNHLNPKI